MDLRQPLRDSSSKSREDRHKRRDAFLFTHNQRTERYVEDFARKAKQEEERSNSIEKSKQSSLLKLIKEAENVKDEQDSDNLGFFEDKRSPLDNNVNTNQLTSSEDDSEEE